MGIRSISKLILLINGFILLSCDTEIGRTTLLRTSSPEVVSDSSIHLLTKFIDFPEQIDNVGYCWSSKDTPTILDDTVKKIFDNSTDEFNLLIPNLVPDNRYFARAYAISATGAIFYGNEVAFVNRFLPQFSETKLNAITKNYFEVSTTLTGLDRSIPIEKFGHVWSERHAPSLEDLFSEFDTQGSEPTQSYSTQLIELKPGKIYYVRPYIKNNSGVFYGPELLLEIPDELVIGTWQFEDIAVGNQVDFSISGDDQSLYLLTGFDGVEEFNPLLNCFKVDLSSNEAQPIAPLPGQMRAEAKSMIINGKVYCGFGVSNFYYPRNPFYDMYQFDEAANKWIPRRAIPLTGTPVVLFATGNNGFGYTAIYTNDKIELWRYSPDLNSWTKQNSVTYETYLSEVDSRSTWVGDKLYFAVGYYPMILFEWDTQTNIVTTVANSFDDIELIFTYNESLYAFVQKDLYSPDEIYLFDYESKNWKRRNAPPIPKGNYFSTHSFESRGKTYVAFYYKYEITTILKDYNLWLTYSE